MTHLADDQIRMMAFSHVRGLIQKHGSVLPWGILSQPFQVADLQIHLATKACGIFRPRQMARGVLSVKTIVPRKGRIARYDDLAVAPEDGVFRYCFRGQDPSHRDNQALRESYEDQTPLIYLFGLEPSVYEVLFPVFITSWVPEALMVEISVQDPAYPVGDSASTGAYSAQSPIERSYATVQAKARLHQSAFRLRVLEAYQKRCAICGFPRAELLDAAHILPDRDVRGQPEVPNGLCLCRLHHGGYDSHLLGIRPDGIIEISPELLETKDGPTLQHGFLDFNGRGLRLPQRKEDLPKEEYLEERYRQFKKSVLR